MSGDGGPVVDVCWTHRHGSTATDTTPFQRLQALDDAIAYRRARVAVPCPDCDPAPAGRRCDDHACDMMLIAA
jgi:hypothetical protein